MNEKMTKNKTLMKRIYSHPEIVLVSLDNEISLSLDSTPPILPGEGTSYVPDYFNNDPFKSGTV
jgi:hypothetical protein